ncbi:hypothetical protein TNCV_2568241 [Trichonephila clavipes]|uniref:Uncharacterized protein n=1 Tax=Trichonephila clavipes TaxID=2585209 RepID=A0A8X6WKK4_TRICX|nr:hypothetical protein TNCV_2568241 [Trichonephila clavipes]
MLVRDATEYTSQSPLVRIDSTLKSARYISGVLRPGSLPFIRALRNPTLQLDNTRLHVAGIVRTFLIQKMFDCYPDLHVHQISRQ